eukprot:gene13513-biopygen10782
MATQILPERFAGGDFMTWLRHFDRCAWANMWNEGIRLLKLPAFLSGPAATYFDSLAADEKDTLPHLVASLQRCFTPAIDREKFYRDFDTQVLRPAEDPSLYLWRLKDLLRNAEPDLSEDAFEALLRRQFMKGLPHHIRMKLLESDPTPNLTRMVDFAQRFRALAQLPADSPATCAAIDTIEPPHAVSPPSPPRDPVASPPQQQTQQQQRLDQLERLVFKMADQQATLIAAVSSPAAATPPVPISSNAKRGMDSRVRCFYCREEGHIVRNCARRHDATPCNMCGGWGHRPQANLLFIANLTVVCGCLCLLTRDLCGRF